MNQLIKRMANIKKECPTCTGVGTIGCKCNENNEVTCPNCEGKGVVSRRVTTSQKVEMPCDSPQCQNGKVTCGVCNGTGVTLQGTPCSACHGSGKLDCPVCGGLGRVQRVKQESWIAHDTCHICNGRGVVECYLCHGTKVRVCPDCKGKGAVLNTGKIAAICILVVLLLAMPALFIAVAGISLGGCIFMLQKERKMVQENEAE